MFEVKAPMLGQSGMPITLEQWFFKEGEHVNKGESLFELSNEKLNQEIESPVSGTIEKLIAPVGEEVEVGALLATIKED